MASLFLDESSRRISPPPELKVELMEHQKTMVAAMETLETARKIEVDRVAYYGDPIDLTIDTRVGVVGDRVGAGKSLMLLALIAATGPPPKYDHPFLGTRMITIERRVTSNRMETNLLVVPSALLTQWRRELDRTTLSYTEIVDAKTEFDASVDLVVVGDRSLKYLTERLCWNRILIDEADSIRLGRWEPDCDFLWLATATPERIRSVPRYRQLEIFSNAIPWLLDHITIRNRPEFIDRVIELPTPRRITVESKTPPEIEVIRSLVPASVVKMINAGDTEGAIKSLNCDSTSSQNIVEVISEQIEAAIANLEAEHQAWGKKRYRTEKKKLEQREKLNKIESSITRIRNRHDELTKKLQALNEEICPICIGELEQPALLGCCNNIFCFECLILGTDSNKRCPFCREKIYRENLKLIDTDESTTRNRTQLRDKYATVEEILIKRDRGSFLIFSDYSATFRRLEEIFDRLQLSHARLSGSPEAITERVERFRNGEIKILMLNASAYGAGLNLETASDLILFHRFNPSLEGC